MHMRLGAEMWPCATFGLNSELQILGENKI